LNGFNAQNTRYTSATIGRALPDQFREDYMYNEVQRNVYTTAAVAVSSNSWAMNTMKTIQTGSGVGAVIPDWSNDGVAADSMNKSYRKYRVLSSSIKVFVRNRETVNPVVVMLFPTQTIPAVSSAAEFTFRAGQQYSQLWQLGPAGSSDATHCFKMKFSPSKFFGPQYHEQDEYAGSINSLFAVQDPATFVYWGLAGYCAGIFTMTTGGIVIDMTLKQRVLCYQVDRDENPISASEYVLVNGALRKKKRIKLDDLSEEEAVVLSSLRNN